MHIPPPPHAQLSLSHWEMCLGRAGLETSPSASKVTSARAHQEEPVVRPNWTDWLDAAMGGGTTGNQGMPASTRGKVDMCFGFGFLLKDSERGLREVGIKIKLSGDSFGKTNKQTNINPKTKNTNHSRVIMVFDNCRTLGKAMFPITVAVGLICVCPLILTKGRQVFLFFS